MPKITSDGLEVLADADNAVLGDAMTVDGPKPMRGGPRRKRRSTPAMGYDISDDMGLFDMGISRALTPYKPVALAAPEDDREELARLLVVPQGIVGGAIKGGIYGALLGNGSLERKLGGGALGGAVAFPALSALARLAKRHLATVHGVTSPTVGMVLDDAAHVGGAAASVAAAGGEAADGAIVSTGVVLAAHVIGWFVGR